MGDLGYIETAAKVAEILTLAGYSIRHVREAGFIEINNNGFVYYVYNSTIDTLPDHPDGVWADDVVYQFGRNIIITIKIKIKSDELYKILMHNKVALINGSLYNRKTDSIYIGHLIGNKYISYEKNWHRQIEYPINVNSILTQTMAINYDLTPVLEVNVAIINEGLKLVHATIDTDVKYYAHYFSILENRFIVKGIYKYSKRNDLFKYENDSGKLFALINNPETNVTYLANDEQNNEVVKLDDCKLTEKDGLYDGYVINGHIQRDGCYRFGDIFFTMSHRYRIIELDARKPDSGKQTKPALSLLFEDNA